MNKKIKMWYEYMRGVSECVQVLSALEQDDDIMSQNPTRQLRTRTPSPDIAEHRALKAEISRISTHSLSLSHTHTLSRFHISMLSIYLSIYIPDFKNLEPCWIEWEIQNIQYFKDEQWTLTPTSKHRWRACSMQGYKRKDIMLSMHANGIACMKVDARLV